MAFSESFRKSGITGIREGEREGRKRKMRRRRLRLGR
jgi:hypothetical protein